MTNEASATETTIAPREIMRKPNYALRPNAQGFDEVRIVTVPRFKESYLSGDEWRISAAIQFFRKGKLISEATARDVETACGRVYAEHGNALDNGGWYAGDGVYCDQEGCGEPATVKYEKLFDYGRDGTKTEIHNPPSLRCFCERHSVRGDCGLDDADRNYKQEGGG